MAPAVLMLMVASLFMQCISSAVATKVPEVMHVTGQVLCQDCSHGYNEWIHGAKPIKGSRVSATCMDERKRVTYYASDETDGEGRFDISVSKYVHGKELKPNLCLVRLVSSPDSACNVLTNFGGGQTGVKLLQPTQMYRDFINYWVGPFYFTTPMCEKPDTTQY